MSTTLDTLPLDVVSRIAYHVAYDHRKHALRPVCLCERDVRALAVSCKAGRDGVRAAPGLRTGTGSCRCGNRLSYSEATEVYGLNRAHMAQLQMLPSEGTRKMYRLDQVVRLATEVHGSPAGLDAALERRGTKRKRDKKMRDECAQRNKELLQKRRFERFSEAMQEGQKRNITMTPYMEDSIREWAQWGVIHITNEGHRTVDAKQCVDEIVLRRFRSVVNWPLLEVSGSRSLRTPESPSPDAHACRADNVPAHGAAGARGNPWDPPSCRSGGLDGGQAVPQETVPVASGLPNQPQHTRGLQVDGSCAHTEELPHQPRRCCEDHCKHLNYILLSLYLV